MDNDFTQRQEPWQEKAQDTAQGLKETAEQLKETGEEQARNLRQKARDWTQKARSQARDAGARADLYVHEYAWTTVALTAVVAGAIGYMLGSRRAR